MRKRESKRERDDSLSGGCQKQRREKGEVAGGGREVLDIIAVGKNNEWTICHQTPSDWLPEQTAR